MGTACSFILLCVISNWYLPLILGFIGVPICLVLLIVFAIKKKKVKPIALIMLGMFICFVAGIIGTPKTTPEQAAANECEKLGHEYTSEIITASTCTEGGEAKYTCTRCGEVHSDHLSPAGHTYQDEIVKQATCAEQGETHRVCSICGDEIVEKIAMAEHDYSEQIITAPTCEINGEKQLICTACGDKQMISLDALGHSWVSATCTTPKTCSVCGITSGEPLGHTTDAGICAICNERIEKQSPVTVIGMKYSIDYVGGVEWTFKIRNNTDKEIKYITFQWSCYNAVGDLIYDQIDGKSYVKIKFTGPLAAGETTGKKRNTTLFYNNTFSNLKWNEIAVEYMDGTTESITEYYYGYVE